MSGRLEIMLHYRARGLSDGDVWRAMQRHRRVIQALDPYVANSLQAALTRPETTEAPDAPGPIEAAIRSRFGGNLRAAARAWGAKPSTLRCRVLRERARLTSCAHSAKVSE
jgi:hypothetical protein